jgi:predicted HAD superfamily Cof-like phosphohydrolase
MPRCFILDLKKWSMNGITLEEKMTNPFRDQEKFMKACDQTTGNWNVEQFNLYVDLIEEEFNELKVAIKDCDNIEILDALTDILVVTIGAAHSMGADVEGAWKEVMSTNFAKIGEDGKVRKREDGKVLKPVGWVPPDLKPFV